VLHLIGVLMTSTISGCYCDYGCV